MQQPRAGAAARDAGTAAGAPPSGAPAASGCATFAGGVVRPPAARRVRAVVPHTGAQDCRRRPATCIRPLPARARARGPPPGTDVGEAHTRLADNPLGPARGQQTRCVRAGPAAHRVFSLTHTHCCVCCQLHARHVGTREARRRASRCLYSRWCNPDEEARNSHLGCQALRQPGPRPAEVTEKEREKNPSAA
jgi:hypothetical protein